MEEVVTEEEATQEEATTKEKQLKVLMDMGYHAGLVLPLCDGFSPVDAIVATLCPEDDSRRINMLEVGCEGAESAPKMATLPSEEQVGSCSAGTAVAEAAAATC